MYKPNFQTIITSIHRRDADYYDYNEGATGSQYCSPGQTSCCLHRLTYTKEQMSGMLSGVLFPPDFEINECRGECIVSPAGKHLVYDWIVFCSTINQSLPLNNQS